MEKESIAPFSTRTTRFGLVITNIIVGAGLFVLISTVSVMVLFSVSQTAKSSGWGIPVTSQPTTTKTQAGREIRVIYSTAQPTPFQPETFTPAPTQTPTATQTFTPTNSPTPSPTETPVPTETPLPPTPTPESLFPEASRIEGIYGFPQSLPLSCESRSAADLARFLGVDIAELDFQYALPFSDNPNTGFVGDPRSDRGQVPPGPYGVHAPPVAALLRAYGIQAYAQTHLTLDDLKSEVASGQPVMVWVIGNVWRGFGMPYTAPDGETLIVAPNEHTVLVIGYSPETITVLDGSLIYSATTDRFLDSWGVLENMAIIIE